MSENVQAAPSELSTFSELVWVFARIGLVSFGGPAAQIALMHRVLVDEKRWMDEPRFLSALSFCMLLPGPEAMQLATYAGWRLHGVRGGLAAGLLFVLPGATLMMVLAMLYAAFGGLSITSALFVGIKGAVLGIVLEALLRVARRALKGWFEWAVAGAAFVAIFALHVPFPVIVIAAAVAGFLRATLVGATAAGYVAALRLERDELVTPRQTLRTLSIWLVIWIAPLVAVGLIFGGDHVLAELAVFFSKLAVVTFGGAYAVLAYMAQEVVAGYRWMAPGEMLDALGLAETTPGPLILVTEFVGVVASWRHGGGDPLLMGFLGGVVTLWATFAPCFLWIFVGAPYIDVINAQPRLKAALAAVTAAVVGVILNLTLWFTLHVLFADVPTSQWGPFALALPRLASLQIEALGVALLGLALLFVFKRGIITTLLVCSAVALGLGALGGRI